MFGSYKLLRTYLKIMLSYYSGESLFNPNMVAVVISQNCNLKCKMCGYWKNTVHLDEMGFDEYRSLFEDFRKCGVKKVQFTGGEPLLKNNFFDILSLARKMDLETVVITNGTLINHDNVGQLVELSKKIYFSLDTPDKEKYDELRGVPGAFERISRGILLTSQARNEFNNKPSIVISAILTPFNLHDPTDMLRLAKDLGADRVIYNPASTVDGYAVLQNHFRDEPEVLAEYEKMVDRILGGMFKKGSILDSNPFFIECSKGFLRGQKKFFNFPCYTGGYEGIHININGDMHPCCAWNYIIGNIRIKSFAALWKSNNIKEARRLIKAKKCPLCYHHTRAFDYILRAPFLIKSPRKLLRSYKRLLLRKK